MLREYLLHLLILIILSYVVSELSESFVVNLAGRDVGRDNPVSETDMSVKILLGIVLSPLVETYLFQQSVLIFLRKLFEEFPYNYIVPIFFSALLFGIMHSFSLYYIIDGFIVGGWFAFMYLFILDRFNTKTKAFIAVWVCHLFLNILAILN